MNEEQIVQLLKHRLSIRTDYEYEGDSKYFSVYLELDGEIISSDHFRVDNQ